MEAETVGTDVVAEHSQSGTSVGPVHIGCPVCSQQFESAVFSAHLNDCIAHRSSAASADSVQPRQTVQSKAAAKSLTQTATLDTMSLAELEPAAAISIPRSRRKPRQIAHRPLPLSALQLAAQDSDEPTRRNRVFVPVAKAATEPTSSQAERSKRRAAVVASVQIRDSVDEDDDLDRKERKKAKSMGKHSSTASQRDPFEFVDESMTEALPAPPINSKKRPQDEQASAAESAKRRKSDAGNGSQPSLVV